MVRNNTPLERFEQARFVDWLEAQGLLFSATAQSTYTTSWSQKRLNHATGLRKGVPDMLVILPGDRAVDGVSRLVFVEMKRQKGGVVSKEQKEWIEALRGIGSRRVDAFVFKGADEAIEHLSKLLRVVKISVF